MPISGKPPCLISVIFAGMLRHMRASILDFEASHNRLPKGKAAIVGRRLLVSVDDETVLEQGSTRQVEQNLILPDTTGKRNFIYSISIAHLFAYFQCQVCQSLMEARTDPAGRFLTADIGDDLPEQLC